MATIERAVSAQNLFWIKEDSGDRIGLVWLVSGAWHWSVGSAHARDAESFEQARIAVEAALGRPVRQKRRAARAA